MSVDAAVQQQQQQRALEEQARAEQEQLTVSHEEQNAELRAALERERQEIGAARSIRAAGGYIFNDERMIKFQTQVIWEAIKEIGWNIAYGKSVNIINVSLPVRIFEPRSFLQRLTDGWAFAPNLLRAASQQPDPLHRLQYVIAFAVAGLHLTVRQWKPFNPILGETYQAVYDDGTKLYLEQTSHHPPVSHYQMFSPDNAFRMYGHAKMAASLSGNAIKGTQTGANVVEFADGGRISFSTPEFWLRGILWGDRIAEYLGTMEFRDKQNGLSCILRFNPDATGYIRSWFVSQTAPTDLFKGDIVSDEHVVSKVDGSWTRGISFDNVCLCDFISAIASTKSEMSAGVQLPSDARVRPDLVALAGGNYDEAQIAKVELENRQRADRALRKEGYEERAARAALSD